MGLFDFLNKKKIEKPAAPAVPVTQAQTTSRTGFAVQFSPGQEKDAINKELRAHGKITDVTDDQGNQNFIDELVEIFSTNKEVNDATFGYITTVENNAKELVLAVGTNGENPVTEAEVMPIKSAYIPGIAMHFASNYNNNRLYEDIKQINFPFYLKDKPQLLHQTILKQWFADSRKHKLLDALKKSKVFALVNHYDKRTNTIEFRTDYDGRQKYISLYSMEKMFEQSGMTGMPKNLRLMEFEWQQIDEAAARQIDPIFYVLNRSTVFEIYFYSKLVFGK